MNSGTSGFSQLGLTSPFVLSPARKAKQDANDALSLLRSGTGSRPAPAGALTSHGTKRIQRAWIRAFPSPGLLQKSTSLPLQGFRLEADVLPEDFWLQPQPIVSHGALGHMGRRGLSPLPASSLWTTQRHRNFPGIWSTGTNQRA